MPDHSLIPETKGRSLEDMDVIFGAVSAEKRAQDIAQQEQGNLTFHGIFHVSHHPFIGLHHKDSISKDSQKATPEP